MSPASGPKPVFAFGSESPADLLNNAAAVTRFLSDVAGGFDVDNPDLGLSETGALGLIYVLDGIENTINFAAEQL